MSKIRLFCWVQGDTLNNVFQVDIEPSATVTGLKKAIHGKKPPWKHIDPHSLELFKFQLPLQGLSANDAQSIKLEDGEQLSSFETISFYWGETPGEILSVILPHPAGISHQRLDAEPGPILKLNCLFLGEGVYRIFQVEIAATRTVANLKGTIKEKKPALDHIPSKDLELWKVPLLVDNNFHGNVDVPDESLLLPAWKLSRVFNEPPAPEHLHIIVKVPSTVIPRPSSYQSADAVEAPDDHRDKRPRLLNEPSPPPDIIDMWRNNRGMVKLPLVAELRALLEKPLADSEKVPISESTFRGLLNAFGPDMCSENDLHTLFTIGEPDPKLMHVTPAVVSSPPSCGTDRSFHSFWDDNIRKIVELLVPSGKTIRYGKRHTETRNLRPNFGYILNRACPFRGEEIGTEDTDDPRAELVDKLVWVYSPAPYMLGYYCRASRMTLSAITAPETPGGRAGISDIITVDLGLRKDRIANIRHLINLCPLFHMVADLVPFPANDFQVFSRENSEVEISGRSVIKTFNGQNAGSKVRHLETIHELIKRNSIPNTDTLLLVKGNTVYLSPRGITSRPRVEKELRECLTCVLEALVVAHQVKLYHRDIRWENVIRRIEDDTKWFLVDWDDAATPPTFAQPTFRKDTHSPDIFHDDHGPEVDIWGIGYLIRSSKAVGLSVEMMRLGWLICEEAGKLTAQEVLELLANCR